MAAFGHAPDSAASTLIGDVLRRHAHRAGRWLAPLLGAVLILAAGGAAAQASDGITSIAIAAAPDTVSPGRLVQYLVTVSNQGTSTRGYSITAQVPVGTTVDSASLSSVPGAYLPGCGAATCATTSFSAPPASGIVIALMARHRTGEGMPRLAPAPAIYMPLHRSAISAAQFLSVHAFHALVASATGSKLCGSTANSSGVSMAST